MKYILLHDKSGMAVAVAKVDDADFLYYVKAITSTVIASTVSGTIFVFLHGLRTVRTSILRREVRRDTGAYTGSRRE